MPGTKPAQKPAASFTSRWSASFANRLAGVPAGCFSTMYTSRASGAQTRKVAPPGARFAPNGVLEVTFSWDAGIDVAYEAEECTVRRNQNAHSRTRVPTQDLPAAGCLERRKSLCKRQA